MLVVLALLVLPALVTLLALVCVFGRSSASNLTTSAASLMLQEPADMHAEAAQKLLVPEPAQTWLGGEAAEQRLEPEPA
eukprot:365743-Chlamydomonas_euryale.AAC.16